jgi:hypothetical protein
MVDKQHLSLDDALEAETKVFGDLASSADFRRTTAFLEPAAFWGGVEPGHAPEGMAP